MNDRPITRECTAGITFLDRRRNHLRMKRKVTRGWDQICIEWEKKRIIFQIWNQLKRKNLLFLPARDDRGLQVGPVLLKLGPHNAWYVLVVRHVWMGQKDLSNLTHTVCFDVSIYRPIGEPDVIYRPIGEPDVTNERMTHLLKLNTFFHIHDARIMTHDASRIRTMHRVDLA